MLVELTARVWRERMVTQMATLERQAEAARQGLAKAEQEWTTARLQLNASGRNVRLDVPRGIGYRDQNRRLRVNRPNADDRLPGTREEARTESQRPLQGAGTTGKTEQLDQAYSNEFGLVRRETDVEVKRLVYTTLAERLESTRVELASNPSPLGVVGTVAVPQDPLPRTTRRTIAVGLLAGLVLAACVVVVRESRVRAA